jgi:hypothetical protein
VSESPRRIAPSLEPLGRTIWTSAISASRVPSSGTGHAEQDVPHLAHDVGRHADRVQLAVVQHRGAVADLDHGVERVGHEHDGPPLALERPDAVEALGLEGLVPHREHLVDQQDVGLDVHRHGEPQPDQHAR